MHSASNKAAALVDPFGRIIEYLRLSITDRCDFRCTYCMAPNMTFLPRSDTLQSQEILTIATAFTELGVKKIRLTGGEPLIRKDVLSIVESLSTLPLLSELTMTTNGSHLKQYATDLYENGVQRINVSLDTLSETRFRKLTRFGSLSKTLEGIEAAATCGFRAIKLNSVIMKGVNDGEILRLLHYAITKGFDLSFIEEMPLGDTGRPDGDISFMSSSDIRQIIRQRYRLEPITHRTGGPSRYFKVADHFGAYTSKIGFISPHSENFCGSCNRVRMTSDGKLLLCLGNEQSANLRDIVRAHPGDVSKVKAAIIEAISTKPEKHHFTLDGRDESGEVQIVRFMNMTGG